MIYPTELTPELRQALGFKYFHTEPMANVYRAAGYDVPNYPEEEHAFVLDRMARAVLTYGDMWPRVFAAQLRATGDVAEGKRAASAKA